MFCLSSGAQAAPEPAAPASQVDPAVWLDKMRTASVQQSYAGVFMFTRGETSSSMRIMHRYKEGVEQERLTQLDGERGEIIRTGSQVVCILPDNRVVSLAKSEGASKVVQAFADFQPGHQYYQLALAGPERLINRRAQKVQVLARDPHRYSYMLWLDAQTGLLLKSLLQGADGQILERFQFTQIDFDAQITDLDMQAGQQGGLFAHETIPAPQVGPMAKADVMWTSTWSPPGFEAVMKPLAPGENVMVYSDGLATYSVFIEKSEGTMMPEGASTMGATVAYARQLLSPEGPVMVTVVGEIPPMTAMMVADAVKLERMRP